MKNKAICKRVLCSVFAVLILASFLWISPVKAHVEYVTGTSNYDEYLQFLQEIKVDAHFVHYEHIKQLGEFQVFSAVGHNDRYQPFDRYIYVILDENEYPYVIEFDQSSGYKPESRTVLFPLRDMRTANVTPNDRIQRGPLLYTYDHGEIYVIGLRLGDTSISIHESSDSLSLGDYPMDAEETIMSRLLSRNYFVVLAAYYELIGDMPLQPGETWFSRMQYIIWPVVVPVLLIAACIAAVWIFLRIRRKKKAMLPTQWHNDRCNRKRIRKDNSSLQKEATRTDHD